MYEDVLLQQHIDFFTTHSLPDYNITRNQRFYTTCIVVTSSIYSHYYIIYRCLQHQQSQCNNFTMTIFAAKC
jgi:hypothetical protein